MRLLDIAQCDLEVGQLKLCSFDGSDVPKYAIFSHRWTKEEVLFADVLQGTAKQKEGYEKLKGAILRTRKDGHAYLWADMCCIDKSSSAELSESINSMWTYYREAAVCYAYLADVTCLQRDTEYSTQFASSTWFTRGWTLQELVAPAVVLFYNHTWTFLSDKTTLHAAISKITGIDQKHLSGDLIGASVSKRMSWASRRTTQRKEDMAYCLMGLFAVNMPLLYGEGDQAFIRLQRAIMETSDDESIFAWTDESMDPYQIHGLLAGHPRHFLHTRHVMPYRHLDVDSPFNMTNKGLSFELGFVRGSGPSDPRAAGLYCRPPKAKSGFAFIWIVRLNGANQWSRIRCGELLPIHYLPERSQMYFPQAVPSIEDTLAAGIHVQLHMGERMQSQNEYVLECLQSQLHPSQNGNRAKSREEDKTLVQQFKADELTDPITVLTHSPALCFVMAFSRRCDSRWLTLLVGSHEESTIGYRLRESVLQKHHPR